MSRPLNFLHLTTFYPPYSFGGDALGVYRMCHALGDAGHRVDVIHCVDSYHLLHPAPPVVKFAEHPRVIRHELRSPFPRLSPLLTQQTGRPHLKRGAIHKVLNSRNYDVIHFHNISLLGPQIMTLEPPNKTAVKVYTSHEHWLVCPTHVLWKYNRKLCDKPDCLRCTLLAKRPPQLWRYTGLLEKCSQQVDQFFCPSRFTANMHAKRGFPKPMEPLPYFLDRVDSDWKQPGPRSHERPYFLFVGRLETIKGLQLLIPLWKHVPDFDLVVAGTGTQEASLRAMASSNPRIKFLGMQSQQQLGPLYFHALACIVPSITYETFGIVSIEAFARKTPVIVRDLGALPEPIKESGGGFVFRNDEELLAAIRRIGASAELRSELGEKGYQAFVQLWSREAQMKLYCGHLREISIRKFGYVPWETERLQEVTV